jgi:transposase
MWLRFVQGRPVSAVTTQFLDWCCQRLAKEGMRVLVLIWDNASWHRSQLVRTWLREHNQQVKQSGKGVRVLPCSLPTKSPWLKPIEAKWVHGKKAVVEADRLLTAAELESRVSAHFKCSPESRLSKHEKVA